MANRVSNEQLEALLEFLQEHPSLVKGIRPGARSKETVDKQWKHLAMKLNSIGSGSSKTGERWKKYWADIKHKSKTRLAKHRQESSGTSGGPSTQEDISETDKKILSIIGEQAVFGDVEHRVPILNYALEPAINVSSQQLSDPGQYIQRRKVLYDEALEGLRADLCVVQDTVSPVLIQRAATIPITPTADVEQEDNLDNIIKNKQMETPQDYDQSNIDMTEIVIYCEDTQTQSAPTLQTLSPSTRGQTSRISISETPKNAPSCSTMVTQQIPEATLHTGLENPVSQPVRDNKLRPRYISNNLNLHRTKTQSRIDPEWVKELEKRIVRVEAEVRLANAASDVAEARIQAEASANTTSVVAEAFRVLEEASKMQAEASKLQTEASKMQTEASKLQAEASKMQAEALLMLKDILPPKSEY